MTSDEHKCRERDRWTSGRFKSERERRQGSMFPRHCPPGSRDVPVGPKTFDPKSPFLKEYTHCHDRGCKAAIQQWVRPGERFHRLNRCAKCAATLYFSEQLDDYLRVLERIKRAHWRGTKQT